MPVQNELVEKILEELILLAATIKEIHAELQRREHAQPKPESEKEPEPDHKTGLIVISTEWVGRLLGLSSSYAPYKMRKIKRIAGVPFGEPLTVAQFCEVTGLKYAEVIKRIR